MTTLLFEKNVAARMRDGATLRADVLRPAEQGRYPVLVTRNPYDKEASRPFHAQFLDPVRAALAGYVVIMQDVRGTGASEGRSGPGGVAYAVAQEGPDGYDTVEWAAALPYSNGAVGMFGGSYLGLDQWIAAAEQPPHLRAIAPMEAPITGPEGLFFRNGVLELSAVLPINVIFALSARLKCLQTEGASQQEIARTASAVFRANEVLADKDFDELPLGRLPSLTDVGMAEILAPLLERGPSAPAYRVALDRVTVPALIMGGWYDNTNVAVLESFAAVRSGSAPLACRSHLLVGPWAHGNVGGKPGCILGEMDFGMAANGQSLDQTGGLTALHLRWFDHWLKGLDNGVDHEPPVRVFVMGEKRWRSGSDWPPAAMSVTPWYLLASGGLAPARPEDPAISRYVYDPAHPTPTLGGAGIPCGWHGFAVRDQRPLSARADVLTFTSAPLAEPLTIMGPVSAELWAGSSAPDTDFVVRLIDVQPSGFMHNLCDGIVRTRYRDGGTDPSWLQPGQFHRLRVNLDATAHTFLAGHRVAVQVTSSNFPRWDRNLNTRDAPGVGATGHIVEQSLYHGGDRASAIELPIVPQSA